MRIEIVAANRGFVWHFRASNGRITGNNEVFASQSNAVRAAKAVVRAVVKPYGLRVIFEQEKVKDAIHIYWH